MWVDSVCKIYSNNNDHASIYSLTLYPSIVPSVHLLIHLPTHLSFGYKFQKATKLIIMKLLWVDHINQSSCNENLLFFNLFSLEIENIKSTLLEKIIGRLVDLLSYPLKHLLRLNDHIIIPFI